MRIWRGSRCEGELVRVRVTDPLGALGDEEGGCGGAVEVAWEPAERRWVC